jgi:hypothetical protein
MGSSRLLLVEQQPLRALEATASEQQQPLRALEATASEQQQPLNNNSL